VIGASVENLGQKSLNLPQLWHRQQKPKGEKYFVILVRLHRLAASFKVLNSFVMHLADKLRCCKVIVNKCQHRS